MNESKPDTPLVSVWMITYNHERYIAQAIEGVLMQKTNFKIELVIGEDCSTDNTAQIIKEYEKKYPQIIKPRFNQTNLGVIPNMIKTLNECTGKYIALCEGDDYWTDPYKLQKQVDFLEKNPDHIMCFTNVSWCNENNKIIKNRAIPLKEDKTYIHSDMPILAPTLTRLFRNIKLKEIPLKENFIGFDAFLLIWQSNFGKIKYINEVTANYRIQSTGIWSNMGEYKQIYNKIKTYLCCLPIVEKSIISKFFLIAIKDTYRFPIKEHYLFNQSLKLINYQYKQYKKHIPTKERRIVKFLILLLMFPCLHRFSVFFRLKIFLVKILEKKIIKRGIPFN
ncbi:MAG: hypothetical protein PWQ06_2516 [Anaerophaga sp.]|nr:hypothetical protein [Anaerophaga sp.]